MNVEGIQFPKAKPGDGRTDWTVVIRTVVIRRVVTRTVVNITLAIITVLITTIDIEQLLI